MRPALRHGFLVERMLFDMCRCKDLQSHDGGAHGLLEAQARGCQKAEGRLLRGLASTCKLLRRSKTQTGTGLEHVGSGAAQEGQGRQKRQRKRREAFCTVIPGHDRCTPRKKEAQTCTVAATLGVAAHLASHRSLATCFAIRYRNTSRYAFHGKPSSATVAGWAT